MPRRKKQKIKVNNPESLQGLLQEVYNDACKQVNDAQRTINELNNSVSVEDVDDAVKIAKAKTDAQKMKDSGVKIKLEVSRVLRDVLKNSGDIEEAVNAINGNKSLKDDFSAIQKMIRDNKGGDNKEETEK